MYLSFWSRAWARESVALSETWRPLYSNGHSHTQTFSAPWPRCTRARAGGGMSNPIDVHERVSPELSTLVRWVMDSHESQGEAPATLASAKQALRDGLGERLVAAEPLQQDCELALHQELDVLIERYGPDALAVRFLRPRAGEELSTVIEAAMAARDWDEPPTLGLVRRAMHAGLLAELVARGEIDCDVEQNLLEEMEGLVRQHGEDALAEELLG